MSIKVKIAIVASMVCGPIVASSDLSPFQTVALQAEVKTVRQGAGQTTALHLRVPHEYTNSLACSGTIYFPVKRISEGGVQNRAPSYKIF